MPTAVHSKAKACSSQHDHRDNYEGGTIEEMRRTLRRDSSFGIPEIDVDLFVSYLLPPLKDGMNVKAVVSSLRRDGLISSDERWKSFETAPAERAEPEDVVFGPLAELCNTSISYAGKATSREPTFVLSLLPNGASKLHSESFMRPDGYFILKEAEDRAQSAMDKKDKARWWYDIAFTAEFKKGGSVGDLDDNVNKLVFNIQQMMTLDASRRFTFGVTVENKSMRLWFCSRATVVASKRFDFTTEVNLLTRIFLSFAFSSKEELGWDPTVRPFIGHDGQHQYAIDVADETYVTEQVLSESNADALISRATRVWKATSLQSGESVVLKDVWIEDEHELEHVIYGMILHDVEEKYGTDVREEVASHLLTPIAHWLVPINGEEDHTMSVMMRGYVPSLKERFSLKLKKRKKDMTMMDTVSCIASNVAFVSAKRELRPPFPFLYRRRSFRRRHYRIVFREVGNTLNTVRTLSNVFIALRDIVKALNWIHGSGWVHRDISVGNLYHYGARGLIGDLEYAKRRNSDPEHEPRTGTPEFMAIEVVKRLWLYRPIPRVDDVSTYVSDWLTKQAKVDWTRQEVISSPLFFHNDLHDLESLWWVAIWELAFHWDSSEMQGMGKQAQEQDAKRESTIIELFSNIDRIDDRRLFFESQIAYEQKTTWMPETLDGVKGVLNALRALLRLKYEEFEAQFPVVDASTYQGTHDIFVKLFDACRVFADGIRLTPYKMIATRQVIADACDNARNLEVASMPSLEEEAEGDASDGSWSDFDTEARDPMASMEVSTGVAESMGGKWLLGDEDFLTPVPSLCVARYELEVCKDSLGFGQGDGDST